MGSDLQVFSQEDFGHSWGVVGTKFMEFALKKYIRVGRRRILYLFSRSAMVRCIWDGGV